MVYLTTSYIWYQTLLPSELYTVHTSTVYFSTLQYHGLYLLIIMPNSFQLPIEIQHMINEIIENWCHENHRITVESFKRKMDYLILF